MKVSVLECGWQWVQQLLCTTATFTMFPLPGKILSDRGEVGKIIGNHVSIIKEVTGQKDKSWADRISLYRNKEYFYSGHQSTVSADKSFFQAILETFM